jgi:hypothetical protein
MNEQHEMDGSGQRCEKGGSQPKTTAIRLPGPVFGMVAITVTLFAAGCTEWVANPIAKSMLKSDLKGNRTYAELKPSIVPPAAGSGRLFVYSPEGPNFSDCTVDENVYVSLPGSYWYLDLPAGRHKFTIGDVNKGMFSVTYGYGKIVVDLEMVNGETKFCRLDEHTTRDAFLAEVFNFTPTMVDSATAEAEMVNLACNASFNPDVTVGTTITSKGAEQKSPVQAAPGPATNPSPETGQTPPAKAPQTPKRLWDAL